MSWKVTYDHIDEVACLFGNGTLKDEPRFQPRFQFRLYDDDGNLCFSGISTDRDSEEAFEPLDFAEGAYGCTRIDYLQDDGEWETL